MPILPALEERIALADAMFCDVLDAALGARSADRVAVVTCDRRLMARAREAGAMVLDEDYPRGLNSAVRSATNELVEMGAKCVCTLLSDIPLVSPEDIDVAIGSIRAGDGAVVLVPSRDFSGTNMIVRKPPAIIATQFGRFSLVRHLDDCRSRGIPCDVVRLERPALDLDVPEDLQEFVRRHSMTHTQAHLARLSLLYS
jgi:2-phospho-L-lactate guanylyltransferase